VTRSRTLVEQHLNLAEAAKACGVSRRTLYAWRSQGIGPRSFKIGQQRIAYRLSDINDYLEERLAATGRGGA
jgi:predicted DNA-binding transcriptional regulator AlpA